MMLERVPRVLTVLERVPRVRFARSDLHALRKHWGDYLASLR